MEELEEQRRKHMEQAQKDHDLLIRIDENLRTLNDSMKTFSLTTEGSIEELRADVESLKTWRWITTGGLIIISALVIPLVVYIFNSQVNIADSVKDGVVSALENYDVTIK